MQLFLPGWGVPSALSPVLTAVSLLLVIVPADTTTPWRQHVRFEVGIECNSHTTVVICISPAQKKYLCPSKATLQKTSTHLGHMTRVQTVVTFSHGPVVLYRMLSCVFLTGNKHTVFLKVVCFVSVRHKAWRQQWAKYLFFFFPCISPLLYFATGSSLFLEMYIFDHSNLLSPFHTAYF